ncbi:MAG: thioesterase family protein [Actinomycetota bacterium]
MPSTLWEPDGKRWVATELSRGPWDPRHCNGGPVAALLARLVETVEDDYSADVDWHVARLTAELIHAVPVNRPLRVRSSVERAGHHVSLISVAIADDDQDLALARGLRIRHSEAPVPAGTVQLDDHLPAPLDAPVTPTGLPATDGATFLSDAITFRLIDGRLDELGATTAWIHLDVDVVPGNAPTGLQRVAAVSDTGNGLSSGLPHSEWLFMNADLSVHLARPVVGEWIALAAASTYGGEPVLSGSGIAEATLYDEHGRLGRSMQSLYVEHR